MITNKLVNGKTLNIRVVYIYPPIPSRDFDYAVYDDNTYEGDPSQVVGYGATEEAAIQDFLTRMEE